MKSLKVWGLSRTECLNYTDEGCVFLFVGIVCGFFSVFRFTAPDKADEQEFERGMQQPTV